MVWDCPHFTTLHESFLQHLHLTLCTSELLQTLELYDLKRNGKEKKLFSLYACNLPSSETHYYLKMSGIFIESAQLSTNYSPNGSISRCILTGRNTDPTIVLLWTHYPPQLAEGYLVPKEKCSPTTSQLNTESVCDHIYLETLYPGLLSMSGAHVNYQPTGFKS